MTQDLATTVAQFLLSRNAAWATWMYGDNDRLAYILAAQVPDQKPPEQISVRSIRIQDGRIIHDALSTIATVGVGAPSLAIEDAIADTGRAAVKVMNQQKGIAAETNTNSSSNIGAAAIMSFGIGALLLYFATRKRS